MTYRIGFLLVLMACSNDETKSEDSSLSGEVIEEDPVEMEWGSWEIQTEFVQQSDNCGSMGANGQDMGVLFAEIDVVIPAFVNVIE